MAANTASSRLAGLGLTLPEVAAPIAAYVPAVRFGDLIATSGQLPTVGGQLVASGRVGEQVSMEQAIQCARVAGLKALAAAADIAGDLDAIARVVRVTVYVASAPGFTDQPLVANGASQLFTDVFGAAGRHARSAVGVSVLPVNAPVEVELLVGVGAHPSIHPL